jgi:TolA-binding protein
MSLYNKGNRLSDMKKPMEAIKSYDEVIATFGDDRRMPERIAKAMVNRANQLGALGKKKDANAGYQAVIERFGSHPDAAVQQQVKNAREWKS